MRWYHAILASIAVVVFFIVISPSLRSVDIEGDYYYKITTAGVQSGYAVIDTSLVIEDGVEFLRIEQTIRSKSMLLGMDVDAEIELDYLLDPETRKVHRHSFSFDNGQTQGNWSVEVHGNEARCTSTLKQDEVVLEISPDVRVDNSLYFDYLLDDFADNGVEEKTYSVLSPADQVIHEVRCTRHATEDIELEGDAYNTLAVDVLNLDTGGLVRMWIDTETAMVVKVVEQDGNVSFLADRSVVGRNERVDLDKYILTNTDVAIADVTGITYMKVRAKIRPTGMQLTPEMLNVPGQTFTGTVEENLIEGVFEVEHPRYDGAAAPHFPPDFTGDSEAQESLGADGIFESDDPVLIEKARELTEGSVDSWEAARRLSEWVSSEIAYAIPGGGTARNTYDIRAGECGAHSILLATFCRAVGIPSRMVWGCMYSPNLGGTFGQHGWTEVYMGEAGWIPVDATAGEIDYVDSGHIRIASYGALGSRLNAKEFEILEYRVRDATPEELEAGAAGYEAYLGEYDYPGSSEPFELLVMDGSLTVNIPKRALLALNDPDEGGRWTAKMTDRVYVTFERGDEGEVTAFSIHEMHSMKRTSDPEEIDEDVPVDLRPYLGGYKLTGVDGEFDVLYRRGSLRLYHPLRKAGFELESTPDGGWATEDEVYTLYFETGGEKAEPSVTLVSGSEFKRR
jgi:transglutaminase-like putative cysteine protease